MLLASFMSDGFRIICCRITGTYSTISSCTYIPTVPYICTVQASKSKASYNALSPLCYRSPIDVNVSYIRDEIIEPQHL